MPSPLTALMGLANGAMGLLQKVFNQGGTHSGFEAQLTAALQGDPKGGVPLLQKLAADPGSVDEELLSALLGNPQAVPLLQYLSALNSMGLGSSDVKALLLGDPQGLSDEGLKTILASCGLKEAEIAQIMADPEGCADLKVKIAGALSEQVHQELAGTGLDVDQLVGKVTADQTTYDAVLVQFVMSKVFPKGTEQTLESFQKQIGTTPSEIAKITAEIKESVTALVHEPGAAPASEPSAVHAEAVKTQITSAWQTQVAAVATEGATDTSPEVVTQVQEGMDDLEQTFNIPKKIVRDLIVATDPQVRQGAVDEATRLITEFLDANAGSDLTEQSAQALNVLKSVLSEEEFAGIEKALRSFNQDLAASIQPLNLDRTTFEVLAQKLGDTPETMTGRYTREVVDQIRQAMPAAVKGNEGSLSLKLNPPMLGRVDIDVKVMDGQVLASFKVDQPVTRDIIQQNMHLLREALSDQGIKATQFVVTTDTFNARDHREALAWFGTGSGRGGSHGQAQERQKGSAGTSGDPDAIGSGYAAVRKYADSGSLDIFA